MTAGWALRRLGWLTEARASRLVRFVIVGTAPIILCLTFWQLELRRWEPWLLPLLGLLTSCAALGPAWAYVRYSRMSRRQTGSFLTCALFSNIGYFGAFAVFALFGERGYAFANLYMLFFTPCFYTLGFGLARRYGGVVPATGLKQVFDDELRLVPFLGMVVGLVVNGLGMPRPEALAGLNHALIPVSTGLYLIAIGAELTFESPRVWWRPCLAMCGIKFLFMPLVAWALLEWSHVEGLARTVVLLEALSPVGVSPLVLPLLFGVDRRLANALFLFTTAAAIPWFLIVLPGLLRV
jgi:predicted permease